MDYSKMGLVVGIEIHQQLDTIHKLFCNCSARLSADKYSVAIARNLRPVAGEMGTMDEATQFEKTKGMEFQYFSYPLESCLVEADEEPPHPLNPEALEVALKIALMLNCEIPEEIQVMRKTIIDGSAITSFQRTALVGLNGWLRAAKAKVGITNVCVEEDSAQIIRKEAKKAVYGLDRLGIPLIEIGTAPDIRSPEQAVEVAEHIGMVLQSTGSAKKGLGTIRQDLNVSIKGGARTEIKGVQRLGIIPKTVELEALRQESLVKKKQKVKPEVRKALPDGGTQFLRPMPGAARMYPETDIPPIRIDRKYLDRLKGNLPELITDKARRLAKTGLNEEMLSQLKRAGQLDLFESLARTFDPKTVAVVLTSFLKQLKGEGLAIERLTQDRLHEMFAFLKSTPLPKEGLLDLLRGMADQPHKPVKDLAKAPKTVSEDEIRALVRKVISEKKDLLGKHNADKMLMGLVMKDMRGKAPGALVMRILQEETKK
jgi:Glu-tRNA(Gln) amidotransferase subunit E-like FAD-binding protein